MMKYLKLTSVAIGLVLLAHAPAFSAPLIFSFSSSGLLSCPGYSCSIFTDSNLIEPSQGYSGQWGFGPTFGRAAHGITASVSGLPAHTSISMDFLLAVIDSWDGFGGPGPDIFEVHVDGAGVFSAAYDIFDPNDQSLVRGTQLAYQTQLGFSGWNDAAYDMSSVAALDNIAHTGSNLTVQFLFPNGQGLDDESFALENVKIYMDGVPVPDPGSSLLLLGMGLVGLRASKRRLG